MQDEGDIIFAEDIPPLTAWRPPADKEAGNTQLGQEEVGIDFLIHNTKYVQRILEAVTYHISEKHDLNIVGFEYYALEYREADGVTFYVKHLRDTKSPVSLELVYRRRQEYSLLIHDDSRGILLNQSFSGTTITPVEIIQITIENDCKKATERQIAWGKDGANIKEILGIIEELYRQVDFAINSWKQRKKGSHLIP